MIIQVLILLVVVGFILWLVNTYVPLQPPFKQVLNVVVVILLIPWILKLFGIFGGGDFLPGKIG